jgi:hypothetical protein
MVKKPMFHKKYLMIILLAITAMSLMSHSGVDALNSSGETCWSCRIQELGESVPADQCSHATEYHGVFLVFETSTSGLINMAMTMRDLSMPALFAWIPPTPYRPPIIVTA